MSRGQASAIISLLAVIAVALVVGIGYLFTTGDDEAAPAATETTAPSTPPTPTEAAVADPVALLESAGIDVVKPPPVPEAPKKWGEYTLAEKWDGRVRAHSGAGPVKATAAGGSAFPASMNGCGQMMYLVTFRAAHESAIVDARLLDAVGRVEDSAELNSGWALGTNCATPAFEFVSAGGGATMTDVIYTVYEYRQASVAQQDAAPQAPAQAPAPTASPEPTFVRCVTGLASRGIYSDGSERPDNRCPEPRTLEGERVCGGPNGWEVYGREKYESLCGPVPEGR